MNQITTLSLNSLEYKQLEPRPYQIKGRKSMRHFTKQWINDTLTNLKDIEWHTTMTIVMATGSGKTPTTGIHIQNMFKGRNALEKMKNKEIPINILILNDRTNLIDQLKKANIEGKGGYEPHFGSDILDHAHIKVFHSKADKKQVINKKNEIIGLDGEDSIEEFGQGKKDNIYFSTFQSTNKFQKEDIVFDVIMIDEAHHLSAQSYQAVIQNHIDQYEAKYGRKPLIIPVSATPDSIMHIVNDPIVDFPLTQYLASSYSPEVDYHLVTSSNFTNTELEFISSEIQRIQDIDDIREKIKEIKILKKYIESHLAEFRGLRELTQDMISRVMSNAESLDHTIIFAPSINDVDIITQQINELTGDNNAAVGFHSKIDEADETILHGYKSGKHKIIIAVDKLNEGIDMPETRNVIFRRGTNSSRVFQQQFGRGLRGDRVSFYDYTGMMTNFSWIGDLNQQVQHIHDQEDQNKSNNRANTNNSLSHSRRGINILISDTGMSLGDTSTRKIQLEQFINGIQELEQIKDYNEISREECIIYLKQRLIELGVGDEIDLIQLGSGFISRQFGLSLIGRCLNQTIKVVSMDKVRELSIILELENITYKNKILQQLHSRNILSKEDLINFGPTAFQETFGWSLMGQVLGRVIRSVNIKDLEELAKILELPNDDIKKNMLEKLKNLEITSQQDLVDFGSKKFTRLLGKSDLSKILGRKLTNGIILEDLKELADILKLPEKSEKYKQILKEQLKNNGIQTKEDLLTLGSTKFPKIFGKKLINRIFGYNLIHGITNKHLEELSDILGLTSLQKTDIDLMLELFASYGVIYKEDLIGYGTAQFTKDFGFSLIGKILGKKIDGIRLGDLEELGNILDIHKRPLNIKLGLQQQKINDMLSSLNSVDIQSPEDLLKFGVKNFKKEFGASKIGNLLNRQIRDIKLTDLDELGKLLWKANNL